MKKHLGTLLLVLLSAALAVLIAWRSWFVVDETEFVLLTEFGRPLAVLGDEEGEAGWHGKWPWRSVVAIDRRTQVSEPPAREVITGDKRNLEVAPFLVWRVVDPRRFLRSSGTLETAAARLDERVAAAINDVMGHMTLENLATTEADGWKLDDLSRQVRVMVAVSVREELGVEVVDMRLRRFNHPLEVRPAIFDLIRSERKREATRLRAEGEAEYRKLVSQADRERDEMLAEAEAEADRIRALGEAEATRILNVAHARDPHFFTFLRTLEAYRAMLDEKTTIVLSTTSPLLRLLSEGPPGEWAAPDASAAGTPTAASALPSRAAADVVGAPESKP